MRGSMFRQRGIEETSGDARVLALLRDITSNWRHGLSGDVQNFAGATTGHEMIDRSSRSQQRPCPREEANRRPAAYARLQA